MNKIFDKKIIVNNNNNKNKINSINYYSFIIN